MCPDMPGCTGASVSTVSSRCFCCCFWQGWLCSMSAALSALMLGDGKAARFRSCFCVTGERRHNQNLDSNKLCFLLGS